MKRFCTMFLSDDVRVLSKDPGMIPCNMQKSGYDTVLVSFIKQEDALEYGSTPQGLRLEYLGDRKLPRYPQHQMLCREAFRYLRANASEIDVLHLFFIKHSLFYGIYYKMLNRSGRLYVKADLDIDAYIAADHGLKGFLRRMLFGFYCSKVADLVTVESGKGADYLSRTLNLPSERLAYLPDGVEDAFLPEAPSFEGKKNVILYAGRIGTWQKNTEMMLEACRSIKWKDGWKLVLAGPVEDGFRNELERFLKENGAGCNVEVTGEIRDRAKMASLFAGAKIFCLTSRFESFGLVCVEAMAAGDYILMTPVCTADDFIGEGGGEVVRNAGELASAINRLMDDQEAIKNNVDCAAKRAGAFRWSVICGNLAEKLG